MTYVEDAPLSFAGPDGGLTLDTSLAFDQVTELVESLHGAGGVDEGNAAVLDDTIESWRLQQRELQRIHYLDRKNAKEEEIGRTKRQLHEFTLRAALAREAAGELSERVTRRLHLSEPDRLDTSAAPPARPDGAA